MFFSDSRSDDNRKENEIKEEKKVFFHGNDFFSFECRIENREAVTQILKFLLKNSKMDIKISLKSLKMRGFIASFKDISICSKNQLS